LHSYLADEIDALTEQFSLNRSDIIAEAIKSYISEQKENLFCADFDAACGELKITIDAEPSELNTLDMLINELEDS